MENQCKVCGDGRVYMKGKCTKCYRRERYLKNKNMEVLKQKLRQKKDRVKKFLEMSPNKICMKCGARINPNKERSFFFLGSDAVCLKCFGESRRINRFSRKYEKCIKCGSTKNKHVSNGVCNKCFYKLRNKK